MRFGILAALTAAAMLWADPASAQDTGWASDLLPWWAWVLLLLGVTFVLGVVAVLGGVGGGVLYVPLVSSLFPFHLDFVRGAGLVVALAGALAAGPALLRGGMASLRLAMPLALIASASAVAGALIGLAMPAQLAQLALGTVILGVVGLMAYPRKADHPQVGRPDALAAALNMHGLYHDPIRNCDFDWKVHRTALGFGIFVFIGLLAGMFGIGAGWANVPVLNLVMGAPLKVSVGTSSFILSIVDSAAAWVYLNQGAMLTIVAVPSMLGMMAGSIVGVGLLARTNVVMIRKIVVGLLLLAGARALLKGLGV